ncbi:hypothetical protein OSTOST_01923 [Ostertagia ostertagi]
MVTRTVDIRTTPMKPIVQERRAAPIRRLLLRVCSVAVHSYSSVCFSVISSNRSWNVKRSDNAVIVQDIVSDNRSDRKNPSESRSMTLNCLHQRHPVSSTTTPLVSCHRSPFTHWSTKSRHSMDNSLFPSPVRLWNAQMNLKRVIRHCIAFYQFCRSIVFFEMRFRIMRVVCSLFP